MIFNCTEVYVGFTLVYGHTVVLKAGWITITLANSSAGNSYPAFAPLWPAEKRLANYFRWH